MHDVDSGENNFAAVPPASLAGAYGNFTFDSASGAWSYALDQAMADSLTAGEPGTDTLSVASFDGSASQTITVNVTGSNDAASITASGAEDTSVTEAGGSNNAIEGDPAASGTLTVHDVDSGENRFAAVPPASLAGAYGNFTFDSASGAWSYALDQAMADSLTAGQHVTDALSVASFDGSASQIMPDFVAGNKIDLMCPTKFCGQLS